MEKIWVNLQEKENTINTIDISLAIDSLMNFFCKFPEMEDLSSIEDIVILNNIFDKLFFIFSYVINFFEKKCEAKELVKINLKIIKNIKNFHRTYSYNA